jgi:hypothetical protein
VGNFSSRIGIQMSKKPYFQRKNTFILLTK